MRPKDFFADVWDKIDLLEKKRLMSQVKKKYGNNHSEKKLERLRAQEYQDSINASFGS